jgi:hypothetical protein
VRKRERERERTVCDTGASRAVKKWIERVITIVGCVRYTMRMGDYRKTRDRESGISITESSTSQIII